MVLRGRLPLEGMESHFPPFPSAEASVTPFLSVSRRHVMGSCGSLRGRRTSLCFFLKESSV